MPSYKLPFWLVFKETTILLLLLVYRLLLLRYVLIVCHNKAVKLVSFLRNAPFRRKGTAFWGHVQIISKKNVPCPQNLFLQNVP
jgi:hypothetical protein